MTQEDTAAATIGRLESRIGRVHRDALMARQRDRLGEVDASLARMPQQLVQLRARGYVYKAYLEDQASELAERWPPVRAAAARDLEDQTAGLKREMDRIDDTMRRLQPLKVRPLSTAQPSIQRLESDLSGVERRIRAAQQAVQGLYGAMANGVQSLASEIQGCEGLLDALAGATFTLESGEAPVAVTEARLIDGNNQTDGMLFLSDQRLLFERHERVARRRILFVTTSSEIVKALHWEVSLASVERVEATKVRRALASRREQLAVITQGRASAPRAEFELGSDSDAWRELVLRCQSGDIASERAGGAPVVIEYIVPARCSSCAGALRQAGRIRGASSIRCEYCGAAIPLAQA